MNTANKQFDARLDLVPQSPGVYLMKDASGSVIYVGKAVNLRSRLRSYFTQNPQGTPKVLAMISHIADFSIIFCENELEALILESTLIKKHQPQYNILLRDDRDYPYIRITMNETYPRLVKAFRIGEDRKQGARYYGPYLGGDIYHALQSLYAIFPIKTCRRVLPRDIGKDRPCLNFHIGRCIGPCTGNVPVSAYRSVMEKICLFLEGRYEGLLKDLKSEMEKEAGALRFEQAAVLRNRIRSLERLMNRQSVVIGREEDLDVIGLSQNASEICLQKMEIRKGRLVASAAFFWPPNEVSDEQILNAFILQHYPDVPFIPREILVPASLPDTPILNDFLKNIRHGRCGLRKPKRGAAVLLLQMAEKNAEESLRRHTLAGGGHIMLQQALEQLGGLTAEKQPPHRIEAYDISNIGAQDQAASMVVFLDGKPARQQYRLFRLEKLDNPDDYASMREVLQRRFRHIGDDGFGGQPDLILVDGGVGHVSTARRVLKEMNLDFNVAGMVKDTRHRTRGLALPDGRVMELHFPDPDNSDPDRMALLRLLTAVQDEAHRFAGKYRGKLTKSRQTRFTLEGIKGIGPVRRRLLLKEFQTIKGVGEADLNHLKAVKGLDCQAAEAVYKHFHPEANS